MAYPASVVLLVCWHLSSDTEEASGGNSRLCMCRLWLVCFDTALVRPGGARVSSPAVRSCTSSLCVLQDCDGCER